MNTDPLRHKTALFMQACVFPGAGYFLVGKKTRGMLFALATCCLVIMPMVRFTRTMFALTVSASARDEIGPHLLCALPRAWSIHKPLMLWSLAAIVTLWIVGIVDVWIMKKKSVKGDRHA